MASWWAFTRAEPPGRAAPRPRRCAVLAVRSAAGTLHDTRFDGLRSSLILSAAKDPRPRSSEPACSETGGDTALLSATPTFVLCARRPYNAPGARAGYRAGESGESE